MNLKYYMILMRLSNFLIIFIYKFRNIIISMISKSNIVIQNLRQLYFLAICNVMVYTDCFWVF